VIGRTIAHYKVTAKLGAGGMGEVYRATDTKLGRDVALKVLPEAFAADAQRMTRFQREAQVLAALNHPHIAAIYGLEHQDKTQALAMELVEGPTLAERIAQGAIPIEEALPIAKQIAEALEYAHERGIIHRDLKPANIKLTADGQVKVLDFGLAKALSDDASAQDISNSPTISMAATKAGLILGTAAYMAPEQARGKAVDRRADIWSFGCVLFEMLTGKQAFAGEAVTEILAAVLRAEPTWTTLPAGTPPAIRRLLRRALHKDPHLRLHSIADARLELEEAVTPQAGESAIMAAAVPPSRWKLLPWAVAALLLISLVGFLLRASKPAPANPVTRFSFGENVSLFFARSLTVSPDGKQLAFVRETGGLAEVYLRSLDQFEAKLLRGATLAREPFFSPDGQWLGFISNDLKIRKYSFADGTVSTVCECGANSASWGEGDRIVFSQTTKLLEVPAAGGPPRELAVVDVAQGEFAFYAPAVLPGGKAVLFTRVSRASAQDTKSKFVIEVLSLADKQRKVLVENASSAVFAATGHLLFHRDGAMLAVPFDPEGLQVTGPANRVLDRVSVGGDGSMKVALSGTGVLMYATPEVSQLVWVDRSGRTKLLRETPGTYANPRLSPDGTRLAVAESGSVWVLDLLRQTYSLLTTNSYDRAFPVWTRDGDRILDSGENVVWKRADGGGVQESLLKEPPGRKIPTSISPDGRELALMLLGPGTTGGDIYILSLEGEKKARPFLNTSAYEGGAQFAPSGKLMAYVSDASGRREVYVTPYPEQGSRWQVSTDGGTHPLWNPNGRELFYRNGDKIMAVTISESPHFTASKPLLLFEGAFAYGAGTTIPNFSVTRDGQNFVMVRVPPGQEARIHVVVNWFEELRGLTGAGKQ
jgi:Tol biopolymer transport system component